MAKREGTREGWSTKKKDKAPKGVVRHSSGMWAARYTCGVGHIHTEKVGPSKETTVKVYHARRAKALDTPT